LELRCQLTQPGHQAGRIVDVHLAHDQSATGGGEGEAVVDDRVVVELLRTRKGVISVVILGVVVTQAEDPLVGEDQYAVAARVEAGRQLLHGLFGIDDLVHVLDGGACTERHAHAGLGLGDVTARRTHAPSYGRSGTDLSTPGPVRRTKVSLRAPA